MKISIVIILVFCFFSLMNHLFEQDKNVSTLFPFLQEEEHFKYISFSLFQQDLFQSVPRNCLSF